MKDWSEMPEAAGAQSEGELYGLTYGSPGMPTIGAIPPRQPPEMRDRERAEADRRWQIRQRVEAAATAISISAMEGRTLADQVLAEAAAAAEKAATA